MRFRRFTRARRSRAARLNRCGEGRAGGFLSLSRMIVPVKVEAHDARAFPRAIESKLARLARRSHLSHAALRALKKLSVRGDDVAL